jgi:alcohol dehydrogenase class IV
MAAGKDTVCNGGDREARAQMAWAATLGGISIALSNTTVAHAMGLPMGARLGTPHGLALSRLLPVVLSRSWQAQPARYAALAEAIEAEAEVKAEAEAEGLAGWLHDFVGQVGLAALWSDQGIDDRVLDLLADDVFRYMGRPIQQHLPVFTRGEMREMYEEALQG